MIQSTVRCGKNLCVILRLTTQTSMENCFLTEIIGQLLLTNYIPVRVVSDKFKAN